MQTVIQREKEQCGLFAKTNGKITVLIRNMCIHTKAPKQNDLNRSILLHCLVAYSITYKYYVNNTKWPTCVQMYLDWCLTKPIGTINSTMCVLLEPTRITQSFLPQVTNVLQSHMTKAEVSWFRLLLASPLPCTKQHFCIIKCIKLHDFLCSLSKPMITLLSSTLINALNKCIFKASKHAQTKKSGPCDRHTKTAIRCKLYTWTQT